MTKNSRSSRSTRGFTLLEVLIAVLILGIIATAALPLLGSYSKQAREAREEANMVVKAQAIDRYNMDHQAPLGTVYDPSDSTLQTYGLETMQGPSAQLLLPTDVNGNVMGDPVAASPGPYSYGPYLAELPPEPASLLLAAPSHVRTQPLTKACLTVTFNFAGPNPSVTAKAVKITTGNTAFSKGGFADNADVTAFTQEFSAIVDLRDDSLEHAILKALDDASKKVQTLMSTAMWAQGDTFYD